MKVSVIMPTYNRTAWIREAIDSYLMQNYADRELIVVDSSTDDATENIVKSYDGIRYYRTEFNAFGFESTNIGIRNAAGELICLLHDDDRFYDETSIAARAQQLMWPTLEVVYSSYLEIYANGSAQKNISIDKTANASKIVEREYVNFTTMMWRKSIHEKIGYFDGSALSNADWLFKIRCMMECECRYINYPTMQYRVHAEQETVKCRNNGTDLRSKALVREKIHALYGHLFSGNT